MARISDNDIIVIRKNGKEIYSGTFLNVPNEYKEAVQERAVELEAFTDLPIMQGRKQFILGE